MSDANAYQHFIFNKEKFSAEQIEKINNSIEDGKFSTTLDLRWNARGDGSLNNVNDGIS